MKKCAVAFLLLFLAIIFTVTNVSLYSSVQEGGWLQYRADAGRCGYTPQELSSNLSLRWKYGQKPPTPAWKGVHTRMTFDYAYETVITDNILYFGSSTDCKVYALDVETGDEIWSFFTDAPVRFAPAVWKDRVFFISDDGYLYCVSEDRGELLWKKRGGPNNSMVLGNDRMISRWPARGGVVIQNDIVYFGSGIWPSEGIYIYAVDPYSGRELWINNDSGGLEWDQPHGGARAKSGISSHGYLVAAGNHLFIPTGRAVPGALNINNGELDYFHLQTLRSLGGSRVLATDNYLFITSGNTRDFREIIGTRSAICSNKSGERLISGEINSQAIVVSPDYIFYVDSRDGELKAVERRNLLVEKEEIDRKGSRIKQKYLNSPSWTIKTNQPESISLIAAGSKIVSGSVNNKVTVMDAAAQSVVWTAEVDGIPYGLAAADGRLIVSTDNGSIYCFDKERTETARIIRKAPENFPYGSNDIYIKAAEEIVRKTGITEGYCLDLGCGDGRLAFELTKKTNLHIYAVDSDPKNVETARKKIDAAGLYGSRITVHHADINNTQYSKYFANLIVSGRSVTESTDISDSDEISRLQRPYGGVICIGRPSLMRKSVRGALDGAGEWTHQYSDPANTITSADKLVRGGLGMLWFRDSDFEMPSRHGRGVAPLFSKGRLFVEGNHGIRAVDAYNGHILWEYYIEDIMKPYDQDHLNGAAITQGNWCIEDDKLYVRLGASIGDHTGRSCLVLDAATGNKITEYSVPPKPGEKRYNSSLDRRPQDESYWGYIAVENGTLFGTIVNDKHITKWGYRESDMNKLFSESDALFAVDTSTGDVKWMYKAEHSIRHNSIAIGNGRVYLIDRPIAQFDKLRNPQASGKHQEGMIVALDAETGKIAYKVKGDIYGTLLAFSKEHDTLIMTYQYTRFMLPSELGGRMTAFRASNGKRLWDIKTGNDSNNQYRYSSRPIINGSTIYLEPKAFDLMTGRELDFSMSRSYACGIISSAKNLMVFRSATLGYIDLNKPQKGTQNFGGIRPGCWINVLPVGGIVLMPDATARCDCSYLIKATIALQSLE